MQKHRIFLILIALVPLLVCGQTGNSSQSVPGSRRLRYFADVHYNVGGLTPFPLPNTIRQIVSYSPGFSPGLAIEADYPVNEQWSISAGLRFDIKGMRIRDRVQYFHTLIKVDSAEFEGDFTGTNYTNCRNVYLSIPLSAVYNLRDKWRFKAGLYAAFLLSPYFRGTVTDGYIRKGNSLGERVDIDKATFDFAEEERNFDYGIQIGAQRTIDRKLFITADLHGGLRPVFPSSFKGMDFRMYNIFFSLGAGIKL